ncbi:MAG: sugar porter family MFS transporter [Chitinophagaceae bacterium]|nr:sugar porter family MFS transporter [Chitinophagaceae bacterium]
MAIILQNKLQAFNESYTLKSGYVYLISAIAALGGVLFGFDLVIISGTVSFFSSNFQLNEYQTGWAVGCINLGAAIGALIGGKVSDIVGRKKLLMICAVLFAVTGIGTGWAATFDSFIFFRMFSGVAVGIAALVCPVYIAEISPAPIRGKMVSFYQLSIVIGILVAYLFNYLLLDVGENNWRWMFSSQAIPSLLFFAGLFFVPESPRWLVGRKRKKEAETILKRIVGDKQADQETKQIEHSFANKSAERTTGIFKKDARYIVFVGVIIAVFSQAVGQNSLFSYAPVIFKQAGMPESTAFLQSIMLGLVNFIFTFIAIYTIDRIGRRKLLLWGAILLCFNALILAICFYVYAPGYITLLFVFTFIAIYAATLGPVTWVLLSEIFPNRFRGNAMSAATLSLWVANFFTTASFPVLKQQFGLHITFGLHAALCLIYFVFVRIRIPETKGKSLEEIEMELVGGK